MVEDTKEMCSRARQDGFRGTGFSSGDREVEASTAPQKTVSLLEVCRKESALTPADIATHDEAASHPLPRPHTLHIQGN